MSAAAVVSPARVIRLPRVRFKRPRWPKGDRVWLTLCVVNAVSFGLDVLAGYWELFWGAPGAAVCCVVTGWLWRCSRNDDGPSAT